MESDYWDMRVIINDEVILDKQGTKLTPFKEVLLIVKKYMEDKIWTSQNVEMNNAH